MYIVLFSFVRNGKIKHYIFNFNTSHFYIKKTFQNIRNLFENLNRPKRDKAHRKIQSPQLTTWLYEQSHSSCVVVAIVPSVDRSPSATTVRFFWFFFRSNRKKILLIRSWFRFVNVRNFDSRRFRVEWFGYALRVCEVFCLSLIFGRIMGSTFAKVYTFFWICERVVLKIINRFVLCSELTRFQLNYLCNFLTMMNSTLVYHIHMFLVNFEYYRNYYSYVSLKFRIVFHNIS